MIRLFYNSALQYKREYIAFKFFFYYYFYVYSDYLLLLLKNYSFIKISQVNQIIFI